MAGYVYVPVEIPTPKVPPPTLVILNVTFWFGVIAIGESNVNVLLTPLLNTQFSKINFSDFISKLYQEILRE